MANLFLQIPIEDIIKEYLSTVQQDRGQLKTILIWTVVVIVINIASVVWNSILQIRLKDREKEISNYNTKLIKKIKVYEDVFSKFNELTLFIPNNNTAGLTQLIQVLQAYINSNKLYIDSSSSALFNKHLDYFKNLIIVPYHKDVRYEADMIQELANNFANI